MRTAKPTTLTQTNDNGIRTLLHGCIGVLQGIAEMFPQHGKGYLTNINLTGEPPPDTVKRGRGNWKVQTGGKTKAA